MELSNLESAVCKYCNNLLKLCTDEGLECIKCKNCVHLRCLKSGSVPGGLNGDVFYNFTCTECSENRMEKFVRIKMSWLQIVCLVLHNLQTMSAGLARRGFFHWRHHVVTYIDRQWTILAPGGFKKKKKWMGTIAGTLSHFSGYIFLSGTSIFNEPAWWALLRPKLTPQVISITYFQLLYQKQTLKLNKEHVPPDAELYETILRSVVQNEEFLELFSAGPQLPDETEQGILNDCMEISDIITAKSSSSNKRQQYFSFFDDNKKFLQMDSKDFIMTLSPSHNEETVSSSSSNITSKKLESKPKELKLLDPFCHYNTSLQDISKMNGVPLQMKLTGGIKNDLILSPYSQLYLKPYIRRDNTVFPLWLQLMAEIQLAANENCPEFKLPPRGPIDYTYVQPEHIPAINSLCNQFFWPGIDMAEALNYPDFSCVAMYKRLIVGFAFLVPNVKATENYFSFILTRPHWRNCGIAKFMIYHLIQTSLGKDITLHVSINNSALFLYQKFGFKVEDVVLDFYDKYYRSDVKECKHAFYCRLER